MCALTPFVPENLGWPQIYQIDDYSFNGGLESLLHFLPPPPPLPFPDLDVVQLDRTVSFASNDENGRNNCNKKISHNANERHRRKKLSCLYDSLRSLLPPSDQKKQLSIPATVSRVLKYIPELQQQLQTLRRTKEEITRKMSSGQTTAGESAQEEEESRKEGAVKSALQPGIQVTRISDTEIAVQISTAPKRFPLSEVLIELEAYGLHLISASSSSMSTSSRCFHDLHLQMDRGCQMKCGELSNKLLLSLQDDKTDHLIH